MITTKLKQKVLDEATKLKSCATQEELNKLDFLKLEPSFIDSCIYGQMTGNCFSKRATELLNCCAVPYSGDIEFYERTRIKSFDNKYRIEHKRNNWLFSAIEYYICYSNKNANLIDYLKGVRETLTVEDL